MKFPFLDKETLPAPLQDAFAPDEAVRERIKAVYTASYRAYSKAVHPRSTRYRWLFARTSAAVGMSVLLFGSATVYAESANVGPSHPLYALKRTGENMQVFAASADQARTLRATFARRRMDEIGQLRHADPKHPKIVDLAKSMGEDISASLDSKPQPGVASVVVQKDPAAMCGFAKSLFENTSTPVHAVLVDHAAATSHLWKECARSVWDSRSLPGSSAQAKDDAQTQQEPRMRANVRLMNRVEGEVYVEDTF